MSVYYSQTIDDLLGDPLVQAVMQADRVDPVALKRDLVGIAVHVATRRREPALELNGASVRFGNEPRPASAGKPLVVKFMGCEARICG